MNDNGSPYHDVRKYAWRDCTFLVLYFTLVVTALVILLSFGYRLLYNWSKVRRKSRRRPRSLVSGYLVLLCGTAVAVWCVVILWKGLTTIQTRQTKVAVQVSDEYITKYQEAVACGAKLAEQVVTKGPVTKRSPNDATLPEVRSSEATLKTFVDLISNCTIPQVKQLQQYVSTSDKAPKKRDASGSGGQVKTMIADYLAQVNTILSELKDFVNDQHKSEHEFILANEYSSIFKFSLLLILALPVVLFLLCLTGVIILATYTVMEQTRDGPPNDTLNEFLSVILQTYGYVGMVISSMFFLIAALLLVTGFSSIFICDMVLEEYSDDPDPYDTVTISLKTGKSLTIELSDAFHRCRRNDGFHDAFALRQLLIDTPSKTATKAKKVAYTSKLVGLEKHLSEAMKLTFLKNDSCIGGHDAEFDKVMKQMKDEHTRLKRLSNPQPLSSSPSPTPDQQQRPQPSNPGPLVFSSQATNQVESALRFYSPPCTQLTASFSPSRRFCKAKPPYFQGLWIACGLTGIMSIHTYAVMFDGSDMVRPREHSSESEEKKKESKGEEDGKSKDEPNKSKDEGESFGRNKQSSDKDKSKE